MAPTKLYFPIDLVVVCRELCDVTTTLWPVKGGIIINGMCGVRTFGDTTSFVRKPVPGFLI